MTNTIKKVTQALAKAPAMSKYVTQPPMKTQTLGQGEAKIVLRPPRSVTPEEAPTILPARESNKTTMMPWKGWFQTFLKENVLSEKQYTKFRETFFFLPDDIYDLQQSPKLTQKIPISKLDPTITAMYRTPSPGSQAPVRQPEFDLDVNEDPYDSGYFKRDTRRRYLSAELGNPAVEKARLQLMNSEDPAAVEAELAKLEAGPISSPGNKGRFATGPTDFDPSGLRATMSVTWEALEKSLDSHMPDHLPTPVWQKDEAKILAWYKERDLPVPVGGYYAPMKVPRERRIAYW
jgi:hypothetical protein